MKPEGASDATLKLGISRSKLTPGDNDFASPVVPRIPLMRQRNCGTRETIDIATTARMQWTFIKI